MPYHNVFPPEKCLDCVGGGWGKKLVEVGWDCVGGATLERGSSDSLELGSSHMLEFIFIRSQALPIVWSLAPPFLALYHCKVFPQIISISYSAFVNRRQFASNC